MTDQQLHLTRLDDREAQPVLAVEIPGRLAERIDALGMSARLELLLRAPGAVEGVVAQIAHLDELSDMEVEHRMHAAERDLARLEHERARRARQRSLCPECGVHHKHGHLLGCRLTPTSSIGGAPTGRNS